MTATLQGLKRSPGAEKCYQTLDMSVIEPFKGIQVKLHTDEVVPVTMVNKAHCSQTRKGAIHTIHTKERMGTLNFSGYVEISFRPSLKKRIFFPFSFGPFS